jgi:hypothetical protein
LRELRGRLACGCGYGSNPGRSNSAINAGESIVTFAGEESTAGLMAAEYVSGVGLIKLGYDAATYFGAVAGCALGIID